MRHFLSKVQKTLKNFSGRTTDKNTRKEETPGNIPLVIEPLPLTSHLSERISALKGVLGNSIDIVVREFWIGDKTNIRAGVIYIDGLVDKNMIFEYILRPLMYEAEIIETKRDLSPGEVFKEIINKRLSTGEVMVKEKDSELFAHLMGGDSIILIDKYLPFIAVCTRAWESRGVEEPANEAVIRGPREGFTETLKVNLALIRRRIKTPYLRFDSLYIGRNTQTNVITAYIDNLANPKLVREAKKRLERIDIDNIISTGQIEELLEDNPLSPFPQLKVTERPDVVAAGLLEGRVAIMTDNTPNALILPATFFELLQGADDYYQRYFFSATLLRMLRLLAVNIALLLPAFYVAITTYHQELLPTALLINIAASREGVPFPALVEALLMEGTFELLREAGLRLPNVVGPAVTIVGALVLGEAAIRAGTVSPAMVIVVALTAIASFSIPSFSAAFALRLLRFPLIILGASLGLFGVMIGLLIILIHLVSIRSFGVPYIAPLAPLMPRDLKDTFMRPPHWAHTRRPRYLRTKDPVKQPPDLVPRPPNDKENK